MSTPTRPETAALNQTPLVSVENVTREFVAGDRRVRAVDDVSLTVLPGETLGVIGESGSGKSTLARLILGLQPCDEGTIRFRDTDLTSLSHTAMQDLRASITAVFQEPQESLNPRVRIGEIIAEPLRIHQPQLDGAARRQKVQEALELVALPAELAGRYPRQLSGGQQQRVNIARAIVTDPSLVVLDEPTSALDLSVQAQVLGLLKSLQTRLGLSYIFISHDVDCVAYMSDRVAVMYMGQLVELGPAAEVMGDPQHAYTASLLSSALEIAPVVPVDELAEAVPDGSGTPRPHWVADLAPATEPSSEAGPKVSAGRPDPGGVRTNALRRTWLAIPPSGRHILTRLISLPFIALALCTVAFALVNLIPSDPARGIAGPQAGPAQIAAINHRLGLDKPVMTRYVDYLRGLTHGSLGNSYFTGRPVLTEFRERVASSLVLIVPALVLGWLLGITIGVAAAYFDGRRRGRALRLLISALQSVPDFLIGVLLIFVLFYLLRIAPAPVGQLDIRLPPPPDHTGAAVIDGLLSGQSAVISNAVSHMILPVVTLALAMSAAFAKNTRALVADALRGPAAEFQRACGLSEAHTVRSAFRLSRTPLLTYGGIIFAGLLGGTAIVETLFAWNGLGQWALSSIIKLDLPVIQGFVLIVGFATLVIYLLLEVVVIALDPRLSLERRR